MAFQLGLSGLNSASKQLEAIGNNVANASTVGFKQSQAQFADMYASSLSGASGLQTGTGGRVATVAQEFTQGTVTNTTNPLDVAINGQGFFQVSTMASNVTSGVPDPATSVNKYSRNGQFQVNKFGYMVNAQGDYLMGKTAVNGSPVQAVTPSPLQISAVPMPAKSTANVTVATNLDARLPAIPALPAFDPAIPATYNNSTAVSIYDAAGNPHVGSIFFQRQPNAAAAGTVATAGFAAAGSTMTVGSSAMLGVGDTITDVTSGIVHTVTGVTGLTTVTVNPPSASATNVLAAPSAVTAKSNDWNVYMTLDGQIVPPTVLPAVPTTPQVAATLTFDASGKLTFPTGLTNMTASMPTYNAAGVAVGTLNQAFNMSFGSLAAGSTPTTQYGTSFGVTSSQDGYTSGVLNNFTIASDGRVQGQYSNGVTSTLAQLTLATFRNPQGLQPMGNNEWMGSTTSGAASLNNDPLTNGLGVLQASAVEASNVDLTAELVNMITAQRIYQANSQSISAQNQMLTTIVNLR